MLRLPRAWIGSGVAACVALAMMTPTCFADDPTSPIPRKSKKQDQYEIQDFVLAPEARTDFPLWVGAGADLTLFGHLGIFAGYGYMPSSYASAVGDAINKLGGNSTYGDMTEKLLSSNHVLHAELNYKFSRPDSGWFFGAGASRIEAQGQDDVFDLLQSATGVNLSSIQSLLAQNGYSASLKGKVDFWLVDLHAGYSWKLSDHCNLKLGLGVAKVVSYDVHFSSSSSAVDSTAVAQGLYSTAESQVKSTLISYGYLPLLSLSLGFSF